RGFQGRLRDRGLASERDDEVECCYSRQTKIWLADPDRNLWEVYAVTGALPHRGALSSSDALVARDRQGRHDVWEHRLGDELPDPAPLADASVDEVRPKGSFNAPRTEAERRHLLAEALRVLRPGGHVLSHGLVASARLPGGFPRLPGPAALVREAPLETEPLL